jgi:anti-anti-sigma factor
MADYRHLTPARVDDVLSIQLLDPKLFDAETIMSLQDELMELVEHEQPQKVIVDFSRVLHCSTAVMNGLLRAKKRIKANGGELRLCGMIEPIRDAYRMLNLDGTVFQIHDSPDEARAAFDRT